jgi:hypothetical protein
MAERNTKIRGNQIFDGTIGVDKLDVSNAPVAGYYLRYNSTSQKFEWVPGTGAVTEIPTLDTGSTYDLTATPLNGSLSIYLNGLFQEPGGSDYSLVGSKITFPSPIDVADILLASYFTEVTAPTDAHAQGTDTTLGEMAADIDLNTHALLNVTTIGDSSNSTDINNLLKGTVGFIVDGGDIEVTAGIKGEIRIPFDCTIESVTLVGDQSGSIVIDINKSTFATFPTTASICASAIPTISGSQKSEDVTLTGWTLSLSEGDILQFEVDSSTTIERCSILLGVIKR